MCWGRLIDCNSFYVAVIVEEGWWADVTAERECPCPERVAKPQWTIIIKINVLSPNHVYVRRGPPSHFWITSICFFAYKMDCPLWVFIHSLFLKNLFHLEKHQQKNPIQVHNTKVQNKQYLMLNMVLAECTILLSWTRLTIQPPARETVRLSATAREWEGRICESETVVICVPVGFMCVCVFNLIKFFF